MARLLKLVLSSPLRHVLYRLYQQWTRLNDFWLNIDTSHDETGPWVESLPLYNRGQLSGKAKHDDNIIYGSVNYRNVRRALRHLDLQPHDVFYDIGCGKGRVLCLAARKRLKRVVGIELFEELCELARQNGARVRRRQTPIEVVCKDAAVADLSDGTAFYLFNPFGEQTLRDVLENLRRSLEHKPRRIRICYHSPRHEYLLADSVWLEQYDSFTTMGGSRASLWRNTNP